jgi:hypothetical protein
MRSGNSERSVSTEESPLMTFTLGVLTDHQEAEMGDGVGPDEGLCDVGHHEPPY